MSDQRESREAPHFFSVERAREILETHRGEEVRVIFLKRTNGEWREMNLRLSKFLPHDLAKVVEVMRDANEQGDMFGEPGPPTEVKNIPLDAITHIKTDVLTYEA